MLYKVNYEANIMPRLAKTLVYSMLYKVNYEANHMSRLANTRPV